MNEDALHAPRKVVDTKRSCRHEADNLLATMQGTLQQHEDTGIMRDGKVVHKHFARPGQQPKSSRYLLAARDAQPRALTDGVAKHWGLELPDALFSIPPDDTPVTVPPSLSKTLMAGLHQAVMQSCNHATV